VFAVQGIGSYPIAAGGSDAVRKRWLPAVAGCEAIAALALTEPEVGSDLKAITTTITEQDCDLVVDGPAGQVLDRHRDGPVTDLPRRRGRRP
jgi:acyl-CoA dehydrogenase